MPNKYLKILILYVITLILLNAIPIGADAALNNIYILTIRTDYMVHVLAFLPWMFLVWLHLTSQNISGKTSYKYMVFWFTLGAILAIFSEIFQLWLPHRTYNIIDVLANLTGLMLGCLVFAWEMVLRGNQKRA